MIFPQYSIGAPEILRHDVKVKRAQLLRNLRNFALIMLTKMVE